MHRKPVATGNMCCGNMQSALHTVKSHTENNSRRSVWLETVSAFASARMQGMFNKLYNSYVITPIFLMGHSEEQYKLTGPPLS